MKRLAFIPAIFLLLTLLAACGDDDETAPMINEVAYAAADYHFIKPQFLPSGMTELTLANDGMELHHQQLLSLPERMTADDLIAGLMSGEEGSPPTGLDAAGEVGALNPGLSGSVTLNLAAGNYVMVASCPTPNVSRT
tara:strand:- start:87 stop:500 length:414 start_codon:yes stop_codon:yes gene_type:complete